MLDNSASGPDKLSMLHGKKRKDIYVVLSKDGSTVLQDPALGRPWSSPIKKLAELHARENHGVAVDLVTATNAVVRHPKNLPPGIKSVPQ
jgi:hypothetical protein